MLTNADARNAVIAAIEANGTDVASASEYNIDAIVSEIRDTTGDYDVEAVDPAEFWAIVERHERTDAAQFVVELPEVGPMTIRHDGEDTDLVIVGDCTMPAIIDFPESEEWEPEVYRQALAAAGWTQTADFAFEAGPGSVNIATVVPAPRA